MNALDRALELCGEGEKERTVTDLGKGKETLGQGDDVLHLADVVDALLDGVGVLSTGCGKDILDTVNVALGPLNVGLLHDLNNTNSWVNSRVRDRKNAWRLALPMYVKTMMEARRTMDSSLTT